MKNESKNVTAPGTAHLLLIEHKNALRKSTTYYVVDFRNAFFCFSSYSSFLSFSVSTVFFSVVLLMSDTHFIGLDTAKVLYCENANIFQELPFSIDV